MIIDILKKEDINPNIQYQVSELFKQLGGNKKQVNLTEILDDKNQINLAYCIAQGKIIGIALLCNYSVISGKKGWIEDVVVDAAFRGKGIGRKLINKLLHRGKELNLSEILLFTEMHRKPAIKLYTDLGFKVKDSTLYSLKLTSNQI